LRRAVAFAVPVNAAAEIVRLRFRQQMVVTVAQPAADDAADLRLLARCRFAPQATDVIAPGKTETRMMSALANEGEVGAGCARSRRPGPGRGS
jgi:hypothetical protein